MSETPPTDNVVSIREAVKSAKPVRPKKPREAKPEAPKLDLPPPLEDLPDNAPVRALGKLGRIFYFLDSLGQLTALKASEIGRLEIVGLFGGEHFLIEHWPSFGSDGEPNGEWKHGRVGPALIRACMNRGLWNPLDRVRGAGCWTEDDGTLVMHCGDVLYVSHNGETVQTGTGLRGRLLYPHGEALPRPELKAKAGLEGPGAKLLDQLSTWNWQRGDTDARLLTGWIGCALLGAAQPWRPAMWLRGGKGSGKSTAQKLVRWIMGPGAVLKAENATPAGVSQTVGYSTLPVSLDELEAKANNQRTQETIELMRIAASGGELLRGGADGSPTKTQLRSCFLASSVLMPPLKPQDRSRMAILALNRLPDRAMEDEELDDADDSDQVLGTRAAWERCGREIRGRLIREWPRYFQTLRAFQRALRANGHDARGADQFAALGAGFDLITHDGFDSRRAAEWGAMLPAKALAETADQLSEERECLSHLLAFMPDHFRGGTKETVAWWLREARRELLAGLKSEENEKAQRALARIGLRLYRDKASSENYQSRVRAGEKVSVDDQIFWLAVSNTNAELARVFAATHWKGEAGAAGTWAQALGALPYAVQRVGREGDERALRLRIDGVLNYVTAIPWETIFPLSSSDEDAIAPEDRVSA